MKKILFLLIFIVVIKQFCKECEEEVPLWIG